MNWILLLVVTAMLLVGLTGAAEDPLNWTVGHKVSFVDYTGIGGIYKFEQGIVIDVNNPFLQIKDLNGKVLWKPYNWIWEIN